MAEAVRLDPNNADANDRLVALMNSNTDKFAVRRISDHISSRAGRLTVTEIEQR